MVLRWEDVPDNLRVTRKYLLGCPAARNTDGLEWVERQLAGGGCNAAVKVGDNDDIYKQCGKSPNKGEEYCPQHGGKKRPSGRKIKAMYCSMIRARERIARQMREHDDFMAMCRESMDKLDMDIAELEDRISLMLKK